LINRETSQSITPGDLLGRHMLIAKQLLFRSAVRGKKRSKCIPKKRKMELTNRYRLEFRKCRNREGSGVQEGGKRFRIGGYFWLPESCCTGTQDFVHHFDEWIVKQLAGCSMDCFFMPAGH
jgi:hypothetical protein